jgi:hypothetical protein
MSVALKNNCSNAEIKSINDDINKLTDIVTAACSTINALTTSNVSGGTKASSVSLSSLNQMTLPSNFEIKGMKTMQLWRLWYQGERIIPSQV